MVQKHGQKLMGFRAAGGRVCHLGRGGGHGEQRARANTATDLEVRARAGRMDLTADKRVYVRKPNRPSRGGGGGTQDDGNL